MLDTVDEPFADVDPEFTIVASPIGDELVDPLWCDEPTVEISRAELMELRVLTRLNRSGEFAVVASGSVDDLT